MIETIDFEILLQLDTEKYAEWALSKKATTRSEKKELVKRLMEAKEKTFKNYRNAVNEVFYKTKYWKQPTPHEKDSFPVWRKMAFERHCNFFRHTCEGNALPKELIVENENKDVIQSLEKFHNKSLLNLYNGWLPDNFYELAELLGTIDFLKHINSPATTQVEKINGLQKNKNKESWTLEKSLSEEGKTLLPKLLTEFKNSKPKQMAYVWTAMIDLGLVVENNTNHTELHRELKSNFGNIGHRKNLSENLKNIKLHRTVYDDNCIQDCISKIKDLQQDTNI